MNPVNPVTSELILRIKITLHVPTAVLSAKNVVTFGLHACIMNSISSKVCLHHARRRHASLTVNACTRRSIMRSADTHAIFLNRYFSIWICIAVHTVHAPLRIVREWRELHAVHTVYVCAIIRCGYHLCKRVQYSFKYNTNAVTYSAQRPRAQKYYGVQRVLEKCSTKRRNNTREGMRNNKMDGPGPSLQSSPNMLIYRIVRAREHTPRVRIRRKPV